MSDFRNILKKTRRWLAYFPEFNISRGHLILMEWENYGISNYDVFDLITKLQEAKTNG